MAFSINYTGYMAFRDKLHRLYGISHLMLQQMKEEFRQQEDNIKKLEEQVQDYKTKGKSQAANRLEYQIQLLKVGYYKHRFFTH